MSDRLTRRQEIRRLRQVARDALPLFGVEPVSISLLAHLFNTTFIVTARDGTRSVLHISLSDDRSLALEQRMRRIESEMWWLDLVGADRNLRVPAPIRTPEGAGVVRVAAADGTDELCTLYRWVAGRFLDRRLTPRHLEEVGMLTARLHDHAAPGTIPAWFERAQVDLADEETEDRVAGLFRDRLSVDAAGVIRRAFTRVRQVQAELGRGPDTFGLIHADIHQKNYLFDRGEIGLIDFGDCGWGQYLYDFAVTLSELEELSRYRELRAALLHGYRQLRDLSPAHEASIDAFILLRRVQDVSFFVQAQENPTFSRFAARNEARVADIERRLSVLPI